MFTSKKIAISGDVFRDEYSLTFDGSNDYLAIAETEYSVHDADFSFIFWCKRADESVDHHTVLGNLSSSVLSQIRFNGSGDLVIESDTNTDLATIDLNSDDTNWHHYAIITSSGSVTAFQDGVSCSVSGDVNGDNLTIDLIGGQGTSGNSNNYEGNISEIAVYNSALTANQVKTIYNGREPYNHKEGSMAGNLTAWWRMGDGSLDEHVGNSGIIQDLTNEGFGNDVITNGGFDADSNWSKGDFTIGSGIATVTTDGANQFLKQVDLWSNNANDGKVVKLEYEITANTDTIALKAGGFAGTDLSTQKTLVSTVGIHRIYIFVSNSGTSDSLTFHVNHTAGETISIDNVKLSVSNGVAASMVNMAADDIVGDRP
mgnify:CR=1 FL=1